MANTLSGGNTSLDLVQADDCDGCASWQLRYEVAVRASYYLALHIREIDLRMAVLDDVAVAWALCVHAGVGADGFQRFFGGYCADIERGVDPSKRNTPEHPAEYRRVWTKHARSL